MNSAKLVAVTQPLIDEKKLTGDEFIAYCARVSNPSNQMNNSTSDKLLKYCIKHKHWSIFEMAHVVMEITTTRDIARQVLRHRSFSFQEFSQRYADPTKDLGFVERETRLQDAKNRQNSIENDDEQLALTWHVHQTAVIRRARESYEWAVKNGIAKEQARAVLPEGLTVSRMYMAGSVRSWIHYCQLRMDNSTQREHRDLATSCWYQLTDAFPSLRDTLQD